MKIHFAGCNFSSNTGPNSFASRLAQQFSLNGHIIADQDDYDVALVFIEPSGTLYLNKPIIQRIDGIWSAPQDFHHKNNKIKALYNYADHVIFQSEFDAKMIKHHWAEPKNYSIIHNGISLETPATKNATFIEMHQRYEKIFVCSANWHPQKRLKDNIELFRHLRATQYPYSCLIILGNNPDVKVADANIYYAGSVSHEICLQLYAEADWMIHLAWGDHCPNTVVEALSQGCPVICSETGGTKEIVNKNGIILKESMNYNFELYDYNFPPAIDIKQINQLPKISVDSSHLDIRHIAKQYEEVFQNFVIIEHE